jgi:hypothetical protein
MLAVLHVIPDSDNPHAIVTQLMDAVPSGSYLAISHGGSGLLSRQALEGMMDIANRRVQQQAVLRTREQVARFFEGTDLVEPGPSSGPPDHPALRRRESSGAGNFDLHVLGPRLQSCSATTGPRGQD